MLRVFEKKRYRYAYILCCYCCCIASLLGQEKWNIQQFGTAHGLPSRDVFQTVTDDFGYRWMSTGTGLKRFDGHRFDDPPCLDRLKAIGTPFVRKMVIDTAGNIVMWDSASDYLKRLDTRTSEVAKLDMPEGGNFGHFLVQHPHSIAVLQTNKQQTIVSTLTATGDWKQEITTDILNNESGNNRYLGKSPTGKYFFHVPKEYAIVVIDEYGLYARIPITGESSPRLLQLDSRGQLWLQRSEQTQLEYCRLGTTAFEVYKGLERTDDARYNCFYEDDQHNLIFGDIRRTTTLALVMLKHNGEKEDLKRILRKENKIISISGRDFQKAFDISTYSGLYQVKRPIDKLEVVNYLEDKNLAPNTYDGRLVKGFAETDSGEIYGNTERGLWFSLSKPDYKLDTFFPIDSNGVSLEGRIGYGHNLVAVGEIVYGVYRQKTADGYYGYLGALNAQTRTWKAYPLPVKESYGRFITPLPDGDLLVFTIKRPERLNNIYRFNPTTGKFRDLGLLNTELLSTLGGSTKNVSYDADRNIVWIATNNGLFSLKPCFKPDNCYFDSPTITAYPEINFPLQTLIVNADGSLLLGTLSEGVQLFDPKQRKLSLLAYDPREKGGSGNSINLPSNSIAEMLYLDSTHLLITTYKGFVVADTKSLRVQLYGEKDGLPNDEFNRLSALLSTDEQLFIGGINGFSRIHRSKLLPQALGAKPRLSRYYFFDEDRRKEQEFYPLSVDNERITVPPSQVYVGFNFITPGAEGATYRTWLEGYERGFNQVNETSGVEYLRIPAGNYTLHVEAADAFGEISKETLKIPIRVQQPWYLRPWFLILSQLLLLGLGFGVYRNRVQRIQEQEAEKTRINRQLAEMEMKILRQQLNPHFIFNALGAIQHFIQSMRGSDAMEYLADFAKLMRMFLESSKQSYIFLIDELKLIKLYVRLEQLRFNNRFDVVYEIDPDLDLDMEDIPSLLLQPFVENAINHGLFHLRRKGTLTIGMSIDEKDRIICTVADDGIGRKAAAELRKYTYKKHKSRATQIVEERLDIFQRTDDTDVEIITEDLYPEREQTGTKVTIIVEVG